MRLLQRDTPHRRQDVQLRGWPALCSTESPSERRSARRSHNPKLLPQVRVARDKVNGLTVYVANEADVGDVTVKTTGFPRQES